MSRVVPLRTEFSFLVSEGGNEGFQDPDGD